MDSMVMTAYRLRRAQRTTYDKLRHRIPASNPHLRHNPAVQRYPAAHSRLRRGVLWRRIRRVQVQAPLRYVFRALTVPTPSHPPL